MYNIEDLHDIGCSVEDLSNMASKVQPGFLALIMIILFDFVYKKNCIITL